jgi:hypothetical protein
MRAEGKVTRRIRKRATLQLESEEATRDEGQVGKGVVTHDFANGDDSVAGALQVSSQPAARRSQDQALTSSFFVESVASSGSRFSAKGDDGVSSLDLEKHAQERKKGVTTLRGQHVVKKPITIFGERLVGQNAKLICHYSSPGVGVRVGGDHANAFSYPSDIPHTAFIHPPGNGSRRHQRTRGKNGTADHATVEKTTYVMGLTIENCVVAILVDAGVRVVFEDLVVRKCSTGMYVSPEAQAAFLAINRCSFSQSGKAVVLHAANATLRVAENTKIYDIGRSFEKFLSVEDSSTLSGANVTGTMSATTLNHRSRKDRNMLKRVRSQLAMKSSPSQKKAGGFGEEQRAPPFRVSRTGRGVLRFGAIMNNIAGMYLMGRMSYVQIVDVTFCNIEDETIMVGSPSLKLTVEGSRFLANCNGTISLHRKGQQPLHPSTIGIALLPDSGNLSISDTVFDGFDHHAVQVHGDDLSVAIASVRVTNIGPKKRLLKLQRMTVINAGVRITGFRLIVTIRNSVLESNSGSGASFKGLHHSVLQLRNVTSKLNHRHGVNVEDSHHNLVMISESYFKKNGNCGFSLHGAGNHLKINWKDLTA